MYGCDMIIVRRITVQIAFNRYTNVCFFSNCRSLLLPNIIVRGHLYKQTDGNSQFEHDWVV